MIGVAIGAGILFGLGLLALLHDLTVELRKIRIALQDMEQDATQIRMGCIAIGAAIDELVRKR